MYDPIVNNLLDSYNYIVYGRYSVRGPISVKHSFSCPAVISVIIISVNHFYNQIMWSLKIIMSCTCNGIWSRILYNRLYYQGISHLHGCLQLVKLQLEKCCTVAVMKQAHKGLVDQALQQSINAHSLEILVKRHRLIKSQDTGLWHIQQWLS